MSGQFKTYIRLCLVENKQQTSPYPEYFVFYLKQPSLQSRKIYRMNTITNKLKDMVPNLEKVLGMLKIKLLSIDLINMLIVITIFV
jgi:hypothetical protein